VGLQSVNLSEYYTFELLMIIKEGQGRVADFGDESRLEHLLCTATGTPNASGLIYDL
jgi:hypothetical protein